MTIITRARTLSTSQVIGPLLKPDPNSGIATITAATTSRTTASQPSAPTPQALRDSLALMPMASMEADHHGRNDAMRATRPAPIPSYCGIVSCLEFTPAITKLHSSVSAPGRKNLRKDRTLAPTAGNRWSFPETPPGCHGVLRQMRRRPFRCQAADDNRSDQRQHRQHQGSDQPDTWSDVDEPRTRGHVLGLDGRPPDTEAVGNLLHHVPHAGQRRPVDDDEHDRDRRQREPAEPSRGRPGRRQRYRGNRACGDEYQHGDRAG